MMLKLFIHKDTVFTYYNDKKSILIHFHYIIQQLITTNLKKIGLKLCSDNPGELVQNINEARIKIHKAKFVIIQKATLFRFQLLSFKLSFIPASFVSKSSHLGIIGALSSNFCRILKYYTYILVSHRLYQCLLLPCYH